MTTRHGPNTKAAVFALLIALLLIAQPAQALSWKKKLLAPAAATYLWVRHGFCLTGYSRAYWYFDWHSYLEDL